MAKLELLGLIEAKKRALSGKRGEITKRYLEHIESLSENGAGALIPDPDESPTAVRRRLSNAAKIVDKKLVIKRAGDTIYFWEEEDEPKQAKRGRPRRSER